MHQSSDLTSLLSDSLIHRFLSHNASQYMSWFLAIMAMGSHPLR